MLRNLTLNNFIIFNHLNLNFEAGFTAVTGETGAGKSVILQAIHFVTGYKTKSSKFLPTNCSQGAVIAEFDIKNNEQAQQYIKNIDIEHDEFLLIIRRTYSSQTNSYKNYLNDIPTTNKIIKELGNILMESVQQLALLNMFTPNFFLTYTDSYHNDQNLIEQISNDYKELKNAEDNYQNLLKQQQQQIEEQSYLEHVLNEIEQLNPHEGEAEELEKQKQHIQKLRQASDFLSNLQNIIHDDKYGINSTLLKLQKLIINQDIHVKELIKEEEILHNLENIFNNIDKIEMQANSSINLQDQAEFEQTEIRLMDLKNIARKYKIHVNELVNFWDETSGKIKHFQNIDELLTQALTDLNNKKTNYYNTAKLLQNLRLTSLEQIISKLSVELDVLNMPNIEFKIIHNELNKPSNNGIDKIEIAIRTNNKSEFDSILTIASGGELSRLVLAFKLANLAADDNKLLIFDEIDSGVSGTTTDKIARKIKQLSKHHQIIIISHQAQVAAIADQQIYVSKKNSQSSATYLDYQQKIIAIAEIISGAQITDEALQAATKLLEEYQNA